MSISEREQRMRDTVDEWAHTADELRDLARCLIQRADELDTLNDEPPPRHITYSQEVSPLR